MARPSRGSAAPSEENMLARMEQAPLAPFYLLSGAERFFVDRCIGILKRRILTSPDLADMLYYPVYGSETNERDLLALANTPPFFDRTQLILIREAEKMPGPCRKALAEYAGNPSPFTCIVLVGREKVPKEDPFKTVQRLWPEACLDFPGLKRPRLRKWAETIAEEKGLRGKVSPALISGLVGEDPISLQALERQIEMLSLFLEDGDTEIPDGALAAFSHALPEEQGWLLTDPLLKGEEQKALAMLHRFLDQGSAPLIVFGRIVWELRRIERVQEAMARAEPLGEIFRALRVNHPFRRDLLTAAARRIPARQVRDIFSSLLERDRTLKLSKVRPQWHLEILCRQILNAANKR